MIEALVDEIGMVVQHISDDGFLTLNRLGGSDSTIARAKRVTIYNKRGKVSGVIGNTDIHLQDSKNGGGKQTSWKDIFVDIGVTRGMETLVVCLEGYNSLACVKLAFVGGENSTAR